MKSLLAFFMMLLAVTAAFPAAAAQSGCGMTGAMQGMTMAPERQHSQGSCCDSNKGCAQTCDMVCAPNAVAPLIGAVQPTRSLRLAAVAGRHPQLTSSISTTTDPPPKTAS